MKKLFTLVVLLLCFSVAYAEEKPPLTEEQQATLQTDIDIFGVCVVDALTPYVSYGFTTEYSVAKGFRSCEDEGQAIIDRMTEYGMTEGEKATVAESLFGNMVEVVDDARNNEAAKRMMKSQKKKQDFSFGTKINY